MHITSLGLPDFKSGVATSRRASLDFFSRWLVGAGGPFEDTKKKKTAALYFHILSLVIAFNYYFLSGHHKSQTACRRMPTVRVIIKLAFIVIFSILILI